MNVPKDHVRSHWSSVNVEQMIDAVRGLLVSVLFPVVVLLHFLLYSFLLFSRARKRRVGQSAVVGFFHPYCSGGGGGERVLWMTLKSLMDHVPNALYVVYTGYETRDDGHVVTGADILHSVKERFGISFDAHRLPTFLFLKRRAWVDASSYPRLTLLLQSLGSMVLGWEALSLLTPDVMLDTMGYAFTYPIFKILGGCRVGCYTHYPTISTDMLALVFERRPMYNNDGAVSSNLLLSRMKYCYYLFFAKAYGWVGRFSDVVMVNSTWTLNHINTLWRIPHKTSIVYPPCDVETLCKLPLTPRTKGLVISVGQFRPEKDHMLQLEAFALFAKTCQVARLVFVGGTRDSSDENRVEQLRAHAQRLDIGDRVEFLVNAPFTQLVNYLSRASIGLHTMWNEHFGICIVEYMAAGCVPVAHRSGGPELDIVVQHKGTPTGFLASTAQEYADQLTRLTLDDALYASTQEAARAKVESGMFSDATFIQHVRHIVTPLVTFRSPPES